MNAPQPLQLPTHEEIEDARTNARLDAQAEYEDQIQYEREAMNDEP